MDTLSPDVISVILQNVDMCSLGNSACVSQLFRHVVYDLVIPSGYFINGDVVLSQLTPDQCARVVFISGTVYVCVDDNDVSMPLLHTVGGIRINTPSQTTHISLNCISTLVSIIGDLEIIGSNITPIGENHPDIKIGDMPSLVSIGGNFRVANCMYISSFGDMPLLKTIGGDFHVSGCWHLVSFGDMPSIETIGGDFHVSGCCRVTAYNDMPLLVSIGGNFYVANCDQLNSLGDIPSIKTIGRDFHVSSCHYVTVLVDTPELVSIGRNFDVICMPRITTLNNTPLLASIGGDFNVVECNSLASLSTMSSLISVVGNLCVASCRMLGSIDMVSLVSIGGDISLLPRFGSNRDTFIIDDYISHAVGLPALVSVDLSSLVSVGKSVWLLACASLRNIRMNSLVSIACDFMITDCINISVSAPLLASIGNDFSVSGYKHDGLVLFTDMSCTFIGGTVSITECVSITTLDWLSSIGRIGGNLCITKCPMLLSADGLKSLGCIGGVFTFDMFEYAIPELVSVAVGGISCIAGLGLIGSADNAI